MSRQQRETVWAEFTDPSWNGKCPSDAIIWSFIQITVCSNMNAHKVVLWCLRPLVCQGQYYLSWLAGSIPSGSQANTFCIIYYLILCSTGNTGEWAWDLLQAKQLLHHQARALQMQLGLNIFVQWNSQIFTSLESFLVQHALWFFF